MSIPFVFFFSSRRRHTRFDCDWSSDVCSSDLGHDTRFLGREFSLAAAEILTASGLIPQLCQRDAPTPVIAHTIRNRKAIGGINMTASHNPAAYQGVKFSTCNGAPATPEVTHQIETNIARLLKQNWHFKAAVVGTFRCREFNPQPA